MPTVLLRPGEADRVIAGHPWIYKGSILRMSAPASDGEIVQVKDHRQRLLGVGMFNSRSKIHVRLLARERVEVDRAFFERGIRRALAVRERHLPGASSFRVVNSESDQLSGLIVDKYEDVLVLQTSALGMERWKAEVADVLEKMFAPRAIVERNDVAARKFEGLQDAQGVWRGHLEGEVAVQMNGLTFQCDLVHGHKTGFYLDQQVNYRLVEERIRRTEGARVLDCFTFQGGFALHAARAGAALVHGVEQSEEAVNVARRNAAANGLEAKCVFEVGNVFDWLKSHSAAAPSEKFLPSYDWIILDPPSFTRNRASVPEAVRGYKEIHLRALRLLKPGGTLATFCCSHHVDPALFEQIIVSAAADNRQLLRRVAVFTQSPDHPVVPAIPETEYLKGFAFELI